MKRSMKKAASLTLAAALVVTSVCCGGNDAQAATKAKKITMNKKKVNIKVGQTVTLKVKKVTPKKASKAVKYKSSNKKIASVSKKGVVKGRKVGKAIITVTSKSNKKATAKVTVNVKSKQQTPPVVTTAPVATATPVVTPAPGSNVTPAPGSDVTSAPDVTNQPATKEPTDKPVKTVKPPTAPPTEKPKAEEPEAEVLDVMAMSELDIAEGIVRTDNEDGSVTLDFTGTSYKGARWYFVDGDKTETVKNDKGEEVTRGVRKPLNLEKYTYVVVEGVNQEGVKLEASESNPDVKKGHDLSAQFLDALDHASHSGLLEIETQANMYFPIKFNLEKDNRVNVAAFEIYSLGDAASKKAGPITVKSIKAYKDKAAYDKLMSSATTPPTTPPTEDPNATPAPDFTAVKIPSGAAVEIDGDEKDDVWKYVPELPIENIVPIKDATVDPASTATAKLAWNEDNLYGLVKVVDPDISFTATANHERDGVEFFLDEDNSGETGGYDKNTDAFQYRMTGLEAGVETASTDGIVSNGNTASTDYAGIETAYSFTDDGYVVEFKIPFKTVKKAGDRVGFDIIVQDCTGDKRAAEIYLRKTDKALSYWNLEDAFGTLELGTDFAAVKIASGAAITIDGTVDEAWKAVPELPIENVVPIKDATVDPASTATAKLAWDEKNLYGLVKVIDPNVSLSAGASHERDGVEFFLDEDYSMDTDFAVNTDAFQYRVTGLEKDKAALTNEITGGSQTAKDDYKEKIQTAYSITDDGYVVEFKIPFKAEKKAGDLVGFDIIVQDCTGDKRAAEIYLRNTNKGLSYWNLSDTFGTLVLNG